MNKDIVLIDASLQIVGYVLHQIVNNAIMENAGVEKYNLIEDKISDLREKVSLNIP